MQAQITFIDASTNSRISLIQYSLGLFIGLLTIVGWTGYTNISKWIRNYVSSRSDEHIRNNEAVLQERVDELFNKKIDILSDVAIGINEFFSGI